jgi:hypothetical protein
MLLVWEVALALPRDLIWGWWCRDWQFHGCVVSHCFFSKLSTYDLRWASACPVVKSVSGLICWSNELLYSLLQNSNSVGGRPGCLDYRNRTERSPHLPKVMQPQALGAVSWNLVWIWQPLLFGIICILFYFVGAWNDLFPFVAWGIITFLASFFDPT